MNDLSERISTLVKQGRQGEARRLLADILQQDPANVRAWSMMAELVDNPKQETDCLRRVLELTDDAHLRGWATMRLARLEKPVLPKGYPAVTSDRPSAAQGLKSESGSRADTTLLVILSIVIILVAIGAVVMIGYWWLPKLNPQMASKLPLQPPTPTPTSTLTSTPTLGELAREMARQGVKHNGDWTPYVEDINGVQMVLVPAGCFMMGSTDEQVAYAVSLHSYGVNSSAFENEQPTHQVCFEEPFWIDLTEVTKGQFEAFGGRAEYEDYAEAPNDPRGHIMWIDAVNFCELRGARLPTEAEWEYSARGPDGLVYPWGEAEAEWSYTGSENVASNPVDVSWAGVYDLAGSAWEWMADWYGPYSSEKQINPKGPDKGTERVIRGMGGGRYDLPVRLIATRSSLPMGTTTPGSAAQVVSRRFPQCLLRLQQPIHPAQLLQHSQPLHLRQP